MRPILTLRQLALLLPIALLACATSCASSPAQSDPLSESDYGKVLIQFRDYRVQQPILSMVNGPAFNATEYYDKLPQKTAIKVAGNDTVNALVAGFDEDGFWESARQTPPPGPGPRAFEGREQLQAFLYVETDVNTGWIAFRKGLSKDELKLFQSCAGAFVEIYNNTSIIQLSSDPKTGSIFK